jgi:hypothetical protein
MSEPTESIPTGTLPPADAPAPRRGACLGRLLSALLVVLITTFVSLAAVFLLYLFVLGTPDQIIDLRARIATSEAQGAALHAENGAMQTQVADLTRRSDANREALGELQQQKAALDSLREDLEAGSRQSATVVAEARASRDAVALFATAEAGRVALLDDMKRRSDRIERFLQRLSDISDDAALDLGAASSPTPVPEGPTDVATIIPTDTPEATAQPTDTSVPEPTTTRRATATQPAEPTAPVDLSVTPNRTPTP